MRKISIGLIAVLAFLFTACGNKTAGDRPHATVVLRDGTRVSGSVMASSPSEITIAGDDGSSRTIPMSQVKSVDYDQAAAPAATTTAQAERPRSAKHERESGAPSAGQDAGALAPDASHDSHVHPDQTAIQTKTYDLAAGTQLSVRTEETIDSAKAAQGQTYAAEITQDVLDPSGAVVIPKGANAQIVIRSASGGGRIRGASDLVLDLQSVSIGGQQYQLSTTDVAERGKSGVGANKRTAAYTGGGAALGAIIGAIAGHGKGAAIGAASGAGAGALTQILTKGGSIKVPAESILTFKLDKPLHITAAS
ncbi:MAG TPA: hypothetical protein VFA33_12895 [Bryobacteraceae bacterium]|nr:hypothetical protein [Bryobacteraceae bacterium]